MKKFSVIIGTYNYGRFIEEAVDSVLAQDVPAGQVELIVVDDGSTDDTQLRLAKYGRALKYLHQENSGQASAFNSGLAEASGEFVCLLDADDAWKPEKLRLTAAAFEEASDIGMVQHFMMDVNPEGKPLTQQFGERPAFYTLRDLLAGRAAFTGTSGLAFRRSFLDKVLPVPAGLFYCADEYLYLNILFHSRVRSLNTVLGFKKIHGANWFAGTMEDTRRLGNYVKVKALILHDFKARLRKEGLKLEGTAMPLPLELAKARVLYYARRGQRREALRTIYDEVLFGPTAGRRLFHAVTLAVSALSPALYLKLHAFYAALRTGRRAGGTARG
ncbi:MAG: glycosyltransferase [Elusimicrobiales bacterium]|nr:glycosyltransferase [Elusimicrobiales bacterium]